MILNPQWLAEKRMTEIPATPPEEKITVPEIATPPRDSKIRLFVARANWMLAGAVITLLVFVISKYFGERDHTVQSDPLPSPASTEFESGAVNIPTGDSAPHDQGSLLLQFEEHLVNVLEPASPENPQSSGDLIAFRSLGAFSQWTATLPYPQQPPCMAKKGKIVDVYPLGLPVGRPTVQDYFAKVKTENGSIFHLTLRAQCLDNDNADSPPAAGETVEVLCRCPQCHAEREKKNWIDGKMEVEDINYFIRVKRQVFDPHDPPPK